MPVARIHLDPLLLQSDETRVNPIRACKAPCVRLVKRFEPVWHDENQTAALIVAPSDYGVAPDLNAVP